MPQPRLVADAFGVVTISLVALLILVGFLCIVYTFYFRSRVCSQGYIQLRYFSGPWIIRITFILFAIWWGIGEIIRLNFLRREGRILHALNFKWQETVCKCYVVSNLGMAEPCLFLTLVFLLHAPLQNLGSGILSRKWNWKTAAYILLCCFPMFILQLFVILLGPELKQKSVLMHLPHSFTRTAVASATENPGGTALCTYPLLSTGFLGIYTAFLTVYLFWLGRRILKLVINKGLQKRVYTLILSVSSFLPLRVLLLGLSVFSKPEHFLFEALAFLAFLALLCCAAVCIWILVYFPVADALALRDIQDLEARRRITFDHYDTTTLIANHNDTASLSANQSYLEESSGVSPGRTSDDTSTKRGSISFRTLERDGASSGTFVELSFFSPSRDGTTSGSSPFLGWPMRPPAQIREQQN